MEKASLFSKERAIRGAKVGTGASLAVIGTGALVMGVTSEVLHPGSLSTAAEFVYDHPTETLQAVGLHTASWAGIGALVDSFYPTSKLSEKFINYHIETYKQVGQTFREIKAGVPKAYNFLKKFDYSKVPYNLTRADQSEARRRFLIATPLYGALSGTMFWGTFKIINTIENIFLSKSDIITQTIADHPLETIGAMTAASLVTAGTLIAFQED